MNPNVPNLSDQLNSLWVKLGQAVQNFSTLDPNDIRIKHLRILYGEVLYSMYSMKVNLDLADKHEDEFKAIFGDDEEQIENYIYQHNHNLANNLFSTFIFQTELVYRVMHMRLNQGVQTPAETANVNQIFANLFDDTQNNEVKDETKLQVLLWKLRNTIHTSGIYFKTQQPTTITYKGENYIFEYEKSPVFLKDGKLLELLLDLVDSICLLFAKPKIQQLPTIQHPSFLALGIQP